MTSTKLIIFACITMTQLYCNPIKATPVGKVPKNAKPIQVPTEAIPEDQQTKSVGISGPRKKPATTPLPPPPPIIEDEIAVEDDASAPTQVEPSPIEEGAVPKEASPEDELATLEDEDVVVYAEDPDYKEYNLSLQPTENDKSKGPLSAATLMTALGLPATASFLQTLLAAYALPKGPLLVEDILSKLLLIDDNLLVNLVKSFGTDALKNQGLTLEDFQAFLLDDDNESMSLLRRLLADASKGKNQINFQSKGLPPIQSDDQPNFKSSGIMPPFLDSEDDDPIIYLPNQEKTATSKPVYEQSPQVNFNKLPPQRQFTSQQPTPYQGGNRNGNSAASAQPAKAYLYTPPTNHRSRVASQPQPTQQTPTYVAQGAANNANSFPRSQPSYNPYQIRYGGSTSFQGYYG